MVTSFRQGYAGTGPGEITPDGCAVELYSRLPAEGEPQVVAAALPPPGSLLELGCGAGRISGPLRELGYDVTGVDESAAMLAHVPDGIPTVHSSIGDLRLGRTFDVVLLGSFLVNAWDPAERQRLLQTCERHVSGTGGVLIQREGAGWAQVVQRERALADGGLARLTRLEDLGDGVRLVRGEYVFPDATWTQTFRTRSLTPEQFERALHGAGLTVERELDETWVLARKSG